MVMRSYVCAFIGAYICVCACVCMCMCVRACVHLYPSQQFFGVSVELVDLVSSGQFLGPGLVEVL